MKGKKVSNHYVVVTCIIIPFTLFFSFTYAQYLPFLCPVPSLPGVFLLECLSRKSKVFATTHLADTVPSFLWHGDVPKPPTDAATLRFGVFYITAALRRW